MRNSTNSVLKNTEDKYFTIEEYQTIVKENQTDKDNKVIFLYTTDKVTQHTFIEAAQQKGYDVLNMDGQLDVHFINHAESKLTDKRFVRVDSDVVEKLIRKDDKKESKLTDKEQDEMTHVFRSQLPEKDNYSIVFEDLSKDDLPIIVTQSEFLRRMKDMSAMGGENYRYMAMLPDNYNLVVNSNHPLIDKLVQSKNDRVGSNIKTIEEEIAPIKKSIDEMEKKLKDKKEEEIAQTDKDLQREMEDKLNELEGKKEDLLKDYGKENKVVKQLIDLALLSNNLLKGESLTKFVKRSVELIEE